MRYVLKLDDVMPMYLVHRMWHLHTYLLVLHAMLPKCPT